jgi:DNA repair exonuclease SbcCD nuclease subunit
MARSVRILLVADTHLGFDLPFKPRIQRRRRGHDFFANFERALEPAMRGEVDLVVHGGDLFFRAKFPDALVEKAMEPLLRVAERGTPIYLVPGNHERSKIPLQIWTVHPNLHIFRQPGTFVCRLNQATIALSGFPFARRVGDDFLNLVEATNYRDAKADIHLLCIHQAVEGAKVGPSDYTFRRGSDVIRGSDIPREFTAVLSGHIHRSQLLTRDLMNRPMPAPVIYPGSVERTAFAERFEEKHYVILNFNLPSPNQAPSLEVAFVPLPARPMHTLDINGESHDVQQQLGELRRRLWSMDPESIVNLRLNGNVNGELSRHLNSSRLRDMAPETMNISLRIMEDE